MSALVDSSGSQMKLVEECGRDSGPSTVECDRQWNSASEKRVSSTAIVPGVHLDADPPLRSEMPGGQREIQRTTACEAGPEPTGEGEASGTPRDDSRTSTNTICGPSSSSILMRVQSPVLQISPLITFSQGLADGGIQVVGVTSADDPGGSQNGPRGVEPQAKSGFMVRSAAGCESVQAGEIGNRLPFFFTSPR